MKWYRFRQNNSEGRHKEPAHDVFIEAPNDCYANAIAIYYKLYFDGCDNGVDCKCCGDRWFKASPRDAYDWEVIENHIAWNRPNLKDDSGLPLVAFAALGKELVFSVQDVEKNAQS